MLLVSLGGFRLHIFHDCIIIKVLGKKLVLRRQRFVHIRKLKKNEQNIYFLFNMTGINFMQNFNYMCVVYTPLHCLLHVNLFLLVVYFFSSSNIIL